MVVLEDEGEGEWEIIPAPSLLADPSIPRHRSRPARLSAGLLVLDLQAGGSGEVFLRVAVVTIIDGSDSD